MICRFAHAFSTVDLYLRHDTGAVMKQDICFSAGLVVKRLELLTGRVVSMSSLFRLPHALCCYQPYTDGNTRSQSGMCVFVYVECHLSVCGPEIPLLVL